MCVIIPLLGFCRAIFVDGGALEWTPNLNRAAPLLLKTAGVALLIGALATVLAAPVGWRLRHARPATGAIVLAPLLLPNYIVYSAWGLLRAPGTTLGDALANSSPEVIKAASFTQAIGGLALWAWPIGAIIIGAGARAIDSASIDALRVCGAGRVRSAIAILNMLRASLAWSIGVIALLMLSSAVPLHVAQIETYAIEVWRTLDESGGSPAALASASPLVLIAIVAGWLLGSRLLRAPSFEPEQREAIEHQSTRATLIYTCILWLISVIAPLTLFLTNLRETGSLVRFWRYSGDAVAYSAITAMIVAIAGAVIMFSMSAALSGASNGARRMLCAVSLRVWIILALLPGVLIGASLQRAAIFDGLSWISTTRFGVVLSHVIRFGAVAAIAGWWMAGAEPRALVEARRVTGDDSLRAWFRTSGVLQLGALFGVAMGCFALSLHEIEAAVTLSPPGAANLSRRILDQLHYLRMEELNAAGAGMLFLGLFLGMIALLATSRTWTKLRRIAPSVVLLLAPLLLIACDSGRTQPGDVIRVDVQIGETGRAPGQFIYPRAIDADGQSLWIIDKTGRVQRLSAEGEQLLEWALPSIDNGFPVGITCAPDGLIYIADTHQHRVLALTPPERPDGEYQIAFQFGAYGDGDGEFYYTTDVAVQIADDGVTPKRYFVGEYGGNDRISVFDADRNFLFSFGTPGTSESAASIQFQRPQSLAFDQDADELIVADAINHRVGRFTADGELIAWYGRPGAAPGSEDGAFNHPYGVTLIGDRRALVAEFGNNRVQMIDLDTGAGLGTYGRAGRAEGELAYPWGIAHLDGVAYVLDSGNNRALGFRPAANPTGARASGHDEDIAG